VSTIYCGVDIGAEGGVAFFSDGKLLGAYPLKYIQLPLQIAAKYGFRDGKKSLRVLEKSVYDLIEKYKPKYAVIEVISGSYFDGGKASSFVQGWHGGLIAEALNGSGCKNFFVEPKTWKSAYENMGMLNFKGAAKQEKQNLLRIATELGLKSPNFLGVKNGVNDGVIEAALLADYASKMLKYADLQ
jgi:hypothetical protein